MRQDGAPSFAAFRATVAPATAAPAQTAHPAQEAAGPQVATFPGGIMPAGTMLPGQNTPHSPATFPAAGHPVPVAPSVAAPPSTPPVAPGIPGMNPHGHAMPPHPVATCAPSPGGPPAPTFPSGMPHAGPHPGQPAIGPDVAAEGLPAQTAPAAGAGGAAKSAEAGADDREKEHVATSLLEVLAQPDSAINPHVRSMAMDTLQALLPEIGTPGFLRMLARRLCLMERPPATLLRTLLAGNDREIVQTLLLDARMPESLLVEIAERSDPEVQRILARRRRLSTAVCNALLKSDDPEVMLELLRNRNAVIEEHGFWAVVRLAQQEHNLHAPLVTREDLPAAVAFDLFWDLPPMQRRFVISRFVSDSEMLERILKIVRPVAAELDPADRAMHIETVIAMICDGDTDAAARRLSRLTGLHADACGRIVSDASGEALTITFKALGLQRRVFNDVIERIRTAPASPMDGHRDIEELRILFDTLSTNKSWVMLTYWDWSARSLGPYSDRDALPGEPDVVAIPTEADADVSAEKPQSARNAGSAREEGPPSEPAAPAPDASEPPADMPAPAEETAEGAPETGGDAGSGRHHAVCEAMGVPDEETSALSTTQPMYDPETPVPLRETSTRMEEEAAEIPEASGTMEAAFESDDARAEEATPASTIVTADTGSFRQREESPAGMKEKELPSIGGEESEDVAAAEMAAASDMPWHPQDAGGESGTAREEAASGGAKEERKGGGNETDGGEEELPDDPLARIDALLRQLQNAARTGGHDRDENEARGKVA